MSYTEQEKQQALALYDETGSIAKVINTLSYPTRQNMYTWIKNRNIEKRKKYPLTIQIHLSIEDIHHWN